MISPTHIPLRTRSSCSHPAIAAIFVALIATLAQAQSPGVEPYAVVDGSIPAPLTGSPGDPARGRAIASDPERGNCSICHLLPGADPRQHGDIAPPLAGAGSRNTAGELRLRIVDGTRINPATIMPAYHRIDKLARVAPTFAGRPILSAQEVEDVIAWLLTLKE